MMHPCSSCIWLYREWLSILPGGTFAEAVSLLRREGNHPSPTPPSLNGKKYIMIFFSPNAEYRWFCCSRAGKSGPEEPAGISKRYRCHELPVTTPFLGLPCVALVGPLDQGGSVLCTEVCLQQEDAGVATVDKASVTVCVFLQVGWWVPTLQRLFLVIRVTVAVLQWRWGRNVGLACIPSRA